MLVDDLMVCSLFVKRNIHDLMVSVGLFQILGWSLVACPTPSSVPTVLPSSRSRHVRRLSGVSSSPAERRGEGRPRRWSAPFEQVKMERSKMSTCSRLIRILVRLVVNVVTCTKSSHELDLKPTFFLVFCQCFLWETGKHHRQAGEITPVRSFTDLMFRIEPCFEKSLDLINRTL